MLNRNDSILVVGDIIIDEFVYGHALGLSAETPTIVTKLQQKMTTMGGAGLVSRHIKHLGGDPTLLSIYDTSFCSQLDSLSKGLKFDPLIIDGWKVTKKTRFFVDGYKLLQVDDINDLELKDDESLVNHVIKTIRKNGTKTVVISDNRHGVVDPFSAQQIISFCGSNGIRTIVDSQISQQSKMKHLYFAGCSIMLLNEREAKTLLNEDDDIDFSSIEWLCKEYECDVIMKLGPRGSMACIDGQNIRTLAPRVSVVDTCGAGDAFLAIVAMSDMKSNPKKDLYLANDWASETCTMKGTTIVGEDL